MEEKTNFDSDDGLNRGNCFRKKKSLYRYIFFHLKKISGRKEALNYCTEKVKSRIPHVTMNRPRRINLGERENQGM